MSIGYREDLATAHRLADIGGAVSTSYFRRELRRWSKSDGSLATEADLAVEDELRRQIGLAVPADAVLGEERGQTGDGTRRWIIDGIDGTLEFAVGSPDWGTLIALEDDGQVVLGICDQPAKNRRYWALKGGGAFFAPRKAQPAASLRVSDCEDLAEARSYIPPAQWRPNAMAHAIAEKLASKSRPMPNANHPAIQVATGEYEFALFLVSGPWDIAAPGLIVEEAGGRFTDAYGRPDHTTGTAIFSNRILHPELIRLVSELQATTST